MHSNSQITVPVLLVAFNRPDTTKAVFDKIKLASPLKLYVAVDGPRHNKDKDIRLVNEVRQVVQQIDWKCEPKFFFHEKNVGAEINVSSAIHRVFEEESCAIILEDDIVAPLSFFKFAEEMLYRYADEFSIGSVTGSNFTPIPVPDGADYFFAKYGHSLGWATWKRAWDGFDLNVVIPDEHLSNMFLDKITNSRSEREYYKRDFQKMREKGPGNSTWDHVARYYHRINNRLCVIPTTNLTSNIGVYGLHAKGETEHHFRPYDETFLVKKHPERIECFKGFDVHHFNTYINQKTPLYRRCKNKFIKLWRNNKN